MTWNFDARAVEPSLGFEQWPEGWWPVVITKAEEKPNTNNDGMSWHLTIKGLDGAVRDKIGNIMIQHKAEKQQTMDIAQKTMSAIMHVCNVLSFNHPGQLANIPFFVKSASREGKGDNKGKFYQDWPDFKNTAGETALDIYKRNNGGGGAPAGQPQQFGGQPQPQPQQQFQPQQPQQQFQQPQQPVQQPVQQQPQQFQQQPQPGPQAGGWPAQPVQQQPQQQPAAAAPGA